MNNSNFEINGIVPIIPTPFDQNDTVDFASLTALIDFAHASGACGICLPAYASEFYKLSAAEHDDIIGAAISAANGRIPVIAQVNTPSLPRACRGAMLAQTLGADAINVAVPRLFAIGEENLYRYFDVILEQITLPVVIQDFNPGGASLSTGFIARLHKAHPHFRYVKLEEPMMSAKVRAITAATSGEVGVLEGWGGMYLPELVPAGICGVMPGLAVSDILVKVWNLTAAGERDRAFDIFSAILPQIVYSLQNMEFFHHAEKRLLCARGIISSDIVRDATIVLQSDERNHVDYLNSRVLNLLDSLGMARNPVAVYAR